VVGQALAFYNASYWNSGRLSDLPRPAGWSACSPQIAWSLELNPSLVGYV